LVFVVELRLKESNQDDVGFLFCELQHELRSLGGVLSCHSVIPFLRFGEPFIFFPSGFWQL
jgi:hypothetical protein